jgi:hypothetical protein
VLTRCVNVGRRFVIHHHHHLYRCVRHNGNRWSKELVDVGMGCGQMGRDMVMDLIEVSVGWKTRHRMRVLPRSSFAI